MTTTNNHATADTAIQCGACAAANLSDAKFCEGCGHSLSEPCPGCGKSVLLTQRFCAACGCDLKKELDKTHHQHEAWNRGALAAAKECDFDHAIALLKRMSELTDYRFKEAATAAAGAINKIESMRQRAFESAEQAIAQAEAAREQGNHQQVVQLLRQVPEKLLSPTAKTLLSAARTYMSEVAELEDHLRKAIAESDWQLVGSLVGQLLIIAPEDKKYVKLSQQVAGKLVAKSKRRFDNGDYGAALRQLASIPGDLPEEIATLKRSYEDADWLSRQCNLEPFATPLLGRLAVRYAKQIPTDKRARQQAAALAARLKQPRRDPRNPFPPWTASNDGWIGGPVGLLDSPSSIPQSDPMLLKPCVGGYHVAIGLALQGLGAARVTDCLMPKKSFLSSLGWRKENTCWGIDIGASSLKAVELAKIDEGFEIVDAYYKEFAEPVSPDRSSQDGIPAAIETAVANLIDEKELDGEPVWVNMSSSDFINRFRRLPPFSDKRAAAVLESELESEMPIPMQDVFAVRWLGPLNTSHARGRPAVVSAAKRSVVEDRLEMLSEAGLKVAGLQTNTIATVNFVAHEFAEQLATDEDLESDSSEDPQPDSKNESHEFEGGDDSKQPTVAIIDAGAAATSLILVSGETHWYRTVASGGEDLTTALSRSTQSSRVEAEKLKRNPAAIESPAKQHAMVEQRLDSIRKRLEWMFSEAIKEDVSFDVTETWCVGGCFLAHQTIRRLALVQKTEEDC